MDDLNARTQALEELIHLLSPVDDVIRNLGSFGWDSEVECATLTAGNVDSVLRRFLNGDLSGKEVERWADAIECREDIRFESSRATTLSHVIFEMANPSLEGTISTQKAESWIEALAQES